MQHKSVILSSLVVLALALGVASPAQAWVPTSRTNIDTVPTGATVFLMENGIEKPIGTTPMRLYRLPRGAQQLVLRKEGYVEARPVVTIAARVDTLVFTLERKIVDATLELIGAEATRGGKVSIDGREVGVIPTTVQLSPGRHQVAVEKTGFTRWMRWVEAEEGQKITFDVVLVALEAPKGAILVSSNPSGAAVRLNGSPVGKTPAVIEKLDPGQYQIDVVLEGYLSWSKVVDVVSEQRAVVDATLEQAKRPTGDLKVLVSGGEGAEVYLDGEPIGPAPVTKSDVKPGTHQVEAKGADGLYGAETVEVRAGEITVARVVVEKTVAKDRARVRVVATRPGGVVKVDGGEPVLLPALIENLSPGTHFFVVEVEGYAPWTGRQKLEAGNNPEIVAELTRSGRLKLLTRNPKDKAELTIDGKLIGVTPFDGELPEGSYDLVVTRADGKTSELKVVISASIPNTQMVRFGDEPVVPEYGEIEDPGLTERQMPMSARSLASGTGHVSLAASWPGWAFPLSVRAGGGVGGGFEIDVELRTAFDVINELEALVKYTPVSSETFAFGFEAGIGGGLGAQDRNSFTLRFTAIASLLIGDSAAIGLTVGTLFHADTLRPDDGDDSTDEGDVGARLYLGLRTEFRILEFANLFLVLEADPLGGKRKLYEESFLDDPDPKLYLRAGVSFVF